MGKTDRRKFLQLMGATAGATTLGTLQANIAKALAIPANNRTGTIRDVEHIVILMQENRPFDHHFGTLRGVRGFNDPVLQLLFTQPRACVHNHLLPIPDMLYSFHARG